VDHGLIDRAIDACYESIIAPDTWPDALHKLARSLDAACLMFYPRNPDTGSHDPRNPNRTVVAMPISNDYRDLLEEYLKNNWFLNHYRAERGFPLLDAGRTVVIEHQLASDEERRRLRVYNELYIPFGFPGFAMMGFRVDGNPWAVPLLKGKGQGHFSMEDVDVLNRLAPHFRRMIALSERLVGTQGQTALKVLEATSCAAFLLDWRGHVIQQNAWADKHLGADLLTRKGRLSAADRTADAELKSLIHAAVTARSPSRLSGACAVAIPRTGKPPLVVEALPTAGIVADTFGLTSAILVVSDPDTRGVVSSTKLVAAFHLTKAEARIAALLVAGDDPGAISDALRISRETVRAHIKALFAKTETHRQAELVALLSRMTTISADR
jgi:DNA-binding CsgD family transcriptional regulator